MAVVLEKKIKFDEDVLSIVKGMEWDNDGKLGKITGGQLDRKLYEKTNKALSAMGGQWNRKAGGHIFAYDPRPQVEGLLDNGVLTIEKDGFFETPLAVCKRMFELIKPCYDPGEEITVLEPSAGLGAIANALVAAGVSSKDIYCIEKNAQRCEVLQETFGHVVNVDFLIYDGMGFDLIYMNPPFELQQDIDHIKHAYSLLNPAGNLVSVMGEGSFFREDKKAIEFREWLDSVGGYSEKLPEGSFKESGTMVNTRLVII
jgi:hypothetical protein